MNAVEHFLRRSRLQAFAAKAHRALPFLPTEDDIDEIKAIDAQSDFWKRLTPEQLESMQSSAKASAQRAAASEAAAREATRTTVTTTALVGTPVQQTTSTHTAYVFSDKFNTVTSTSTTRITSSSAVRSTAGAVSSSSAARSSSSSSSSLTPSTTSSARASSSTSSATPSTTSSTTSSTTVRTITREAVTSSSSSSSAAASASIVAANASSTSDGLSTGAIAGIVVAAIVGIVAVGSCIGWLYRKHAQRGYAVEAPWAKIDDDITPFTGTEKYGRHDDDDIYGTTGAPVIGSRRALALARQNAFNDDGTYRPDSEYMDPNSNRAGVGSGTASHGAYPNLPSPYYGVDPHGRPYNPDASRAPMPHMYQDLMSDSPHTMSAPGNSRQLVGPGGYSQPDLSPHALGRPAAPDSNFAIAQHEDFSDGPDMLSPTNDYSTGPYTPRTATTMGEWGGNPSDPQGRSRVSMLMPQAGAASTEYIRPPPAAAVDSFPIAMPVAAVRSAQPAPSTLPSFEPMSPLMADFDLRRNSTQPLAMYEDEKSEQKRMYGEVASTAGVPEPPTPKSAAGLNDSTSTWETSSSFSAPEPMPRLPSFTVNPPQPYIHGRPLSPLDELPTPLSTTTGLTDAPVPSSSLIHAETNPYERTLLSANRSPAPPYSATSSTAATGFPSPAYPPPSPGGMSVPGSVTDSPQRWDTPRGPAARGRQSMYDEEDAYGGI